MPGYSTLTRFSLIQLHSEDRKQRAHLKKITEMQRRSGLDNGVPFRLPHLNQNFLKQLTERRQEINKENDIKSKKLLSIMSSKNTYPPPPPFHPTNQTPRNHTMDVSHANAKYVERIAKTKGKYDAREWRKQYEQHKEHLRLRKDNKLFTPLDIGINRQRIIRTNSLMNSRRPSLTSSYSIFYKYGKND
jgi:hypothetical protein